MRQEEILNSLRELGPSTAVEIAMHIHGDDYNMSVRNLAHARLRTLLRQGFVRKVGERRNQRSGVPSPIYEVVE
ncbi:MAG: hypothetical protein J6K69_07340 [Candidatus Methanomethylophilaceae archaeon]|nr:hypothetical protein [Candidatus Methanomethylophilaceae archaeon]